MKLEKWQQVSRIFNAALEIEAADREAFVEKMCAGDAELRAEVNALISAHDSFDSFIDSPEAGVSNIRRFPIDGAKPVKMTNFTKSLIYNLDLAPDGRRLALSRGTSKSDVILIQATNSGQ